MHPCGLDESYSLSIGRVFKNERVKKRLPPSCTHQRLYDFFVSPWQPLHRKSICSFLPASPAEKSAENRVEMKYLIVCPYINHSTPRQKGRHYVSVIGNIEKIPLANFEHLSSNQTPRLRFRGASQLLKSSELYRVHRHASK